MSMRYLPGVVTLELDTDRCNGCRMCTLVCPHAVFVVHNGKAAIVDLDGCMECGACAMNCPEGALSVNRGVGCAYAILKGKLRGSAPTCV
jgi:NAD-dependent dihydropyrimidine dehydrogenase PreA subunit